MAIKKNTDAAKAATEAPAKAAATKTKAAAKPAKAPKAAKPVVEAAPVEAVKVEKVGRKELALGIREKVAATGAAISPKVAELAVQALEDVVTEMMAAGKQVALTGFGTFSSVARPEAVRPNPQKKGETITVPAHYAPKFKAGAKLKSALNGGDSVGGEEAAGDE